MVKNLPSNAGEAGSICGQETKISHATGQKSPRPIIRSAAACNWRKYACHSKDSPWPKNNNKIKF